MKALSGTAESGEQERTSGRKTVAESRIGNAADSAAATALRTQSRQLLSLGSATAVHALRPAGAARRASTFRVLQQTVGNRRVQRLIQHASANPPSATHAGSNESSLDCQQFSPLLHDKRDEHGGGHAPPPSKTTPAHDAVTATEAHSPKAPAPASRATPAKTSIQAEASNQARAIDADCTRSEAQIVSLAATRRREVGERFSAIRTQIAGAFRNASSGVQNAINAKQAELSAMAAKILVSVQKLISDAVTGVQSRANQVRQDLTSFIQTATTSLQAKVKGVAGQILGLVNAIPLPDLPGVGAIRNLATSLLRQASDAVNSALASVLSFVRDALSAGIEAVVAVVEAVGKFASAAASAVASGITRVIQLIAQTLSKAAALIISSVGNVLSAAVGPALSRVESQILNAIGKGQQQALAAIRANGRQHRAALQAVLHPPAGGGGAAGGQSQGGAADPSAELRRITQEAVRTNQTIVQTFAEKTSGTLGQLFQAVISGAGKVVTGVLASVAHALQIITGRVAQLADAIGKLVQSVTALIQSVLQSVATAVTTVVGFVRSAVQNPIDTLVNAVQNIWGTIKGFFASLARDLLSGGASVLSGIRSAISSFLSGPSRGPITKPRPPGGPITLPGLGTILAVFFIVGAIVVLVFPELAVVVAALTALGLSEAAAIVVIGLAAVALLLLALLVLVLIIRRLLRPAPAPKPKPPPCTITTRTLAAAPDGSPTTRAVVGVNERVELTASTAVTWSAKCGTVTPTGPATTTIWTAPDKGASCLINAVPSSGSACSATFTVVPPERRSLVQPAPRSYNAGLAGSGFVAKVVILPTHVSFTRIQVREDTVKAVATGYYDKVLGWNGVPHPVGTWLAVDATNSGIQDTVGTNPPGTAGPFSAGRFHWAIPQQYRVAGTGSAITYSTGDHIQNMTGTTGEETTTKEGAVGGPRKP